jgi:hypothetical protein
MENCHENINEDNSELTGGKICKVGKLAMLNLKVHHPVISPEIRSHHVALMVHLSITKGMGSPSLGYESTPWGDHGGSRGMMQEIDGSLLGHLDPHITPRGWLLPVLKKLHLLIGICVCVCVCVCVCKNTLKPGTNGSRL